MGLFLNCDRSKIGTLTLINSFFALRTSKGHVFYNVCVRQFGLWSWELYVCFLSVGPIPNIPIFSNNCISKVSRKAS
jgi:hypothetical protein